MTIHMSAAIPNEFKCPFQQVDHGGWVAFTLRRMLPQARLLEPGNAWQAIVRVSFCNPLW